MSINYAKKTAHWIIFWTIGGKIYAKRSKESNPARFFSKPVISVTTDDRDGNQLNSSGVGDPNDDEA